MTEWPSSAPSCISAARASSPGTATAPHKAANPKREESVRMGDMKISSKNKNETAE
jgi:hypothetical protein